MSGEDRQFSGIEADAFSGEDMGNFYMNLPGKYTNGEEVDDLKRRIRAAVCDFLSTNEVIGGWWSDWANQYPDQLKPELAGILTRQIVRPVYVHLRQLGFGQEQLVA